MARQSSRFVCQSCGAIHGKWAGQCDQCSAWNTIAEETGGETRPKGLTPGRGRPIDFVGLGDQGIEPPRMLTGISEFDRVCGGGMVPGSAILIGGDPGIGKSTLLLQAVCRMARDQSCAYISGEEAVEQVRMRATRLGLGGADIGLASATSVRDIVASLDRPDGPKVAVIDSIQTMYIDSLDSAPGTVGQVRSSASELIRVAKRRGICLLLVGHVTKDGSIAGPRVLEHMVDCVLHFEGERGHHFRILRGIKNRFGPTDEIGVFEMAEEGLLEVENPSELFLADRRGDVSGAAVFAGLEGTRPVLVEIQALVAPSPLGTPRRAVVGWDNARLAMVLAVLEARCGVPIGPRDVYLNVAGGLRIAEPAADLAVAAALLSSLSGRPLPAETVVFGEIGLSAEVRAVSQGDARLKEAAKLGFTNAIIPVRRSRRTRKSNQSAAAESGLALQEITHLEDLLPMFGDDLWAGNGK